MKIAIISDSHDNLPNFKKAIDWIEKEKIKTIIHCGDINSPAGLKEATQNFSGKIHLVFGNMDDSLLFSRAISEKTIKNAIFYGEIGEIEKGNKKIAFCHFPESAKKLALSGKYDLVFYGHTHKPWEEKIGAFNKLSTNPELHRRVGKCKLVNPGNLEGLFYKATFAVYDTKDDKLELKILEKLCPKK